MTYIADFYDEISRELVVERGEFQYVRIGSMTLAGADQTMFVRNQQTGIVLAVTPTSMTAIKQAA